MVIKPDREMSAAALPYQAGADTAALPDQTHSSPGGNVGAASGAAAHAQDGSLTLAQLEELLQQQLQDYAAARQHVLLLRCGAKLLYGNKGVGTVQVAAVLPKVDTLLQHLRHGAAGMVEGKTKLSPAAAAGYIRHLLHVLDMDDVKAALGGPQQVESLQAVVQATLVEFQDPVNSSSLAEDGTSLATGEAPNQNADKPEAWLAQAPNNQEAAAAAAATAPCAAAGSSHSLTFAELQRVLSTHRLPPRQMSDLLSPVRRIGLLLQLSDEALAAKHMSELLAQRPLLRAHLQQRVNGDIQGSLL